MISQTKMAQEVTRREGGKKNLSIAQVTEVQGHVLDVLAEKVAAGDAADVLVLLAKRTKNKR